MLKKLSLAAVIAVSGVSFVSATPLTDAIKNVDLSGFARVRFYNEDPENDSSYNIWRVSGLLKFTIPAGESIKFVNAFTYDQKVKNGATSGNPNTDLGDNTFKISKLYMQYSANGANLILGKIPVETSVTGSGFGEATGVGAIATYKVMDQLTVAAGYVDAVKDIDAVEGKVDSNDIYTVAAIFKSDMVSGNIWYYHITDLAKYVATLSLDVKPVEMVSVHFDYAQGKADFDGAKTHRYYNVSVEGSANGASAVIGYAATNKKEGGVVLDNDAPIAAVGQTANNYSIANETDRNMWYLKASYKVDNFTPYVAYNHQDDGTVADNDLNQYTVGVKYKYNKKLGFHVYYDVADFDNDGDDNNEFRFEAKYSF